ncbi:MAG: hypothetical protein KAS22_08295 [Candidatus Heimdallarchaeota archaeon]|nr:hypothetical protein [Candidatus Heimdallarchaeota archaeon]
MATKKKIMDIIGLISICIVAVCFISIIIMSFVITRRYAAEDYSELLTNYADYKLIYSIESIISLVNSIFIIPATIGVFINLYSKIKENRKNWLILPTATTIIGSLLLISLIIIKLMLIFNTAPSYVSAIEPAKSEILTFFENRVGYLSIFQVVGYLFLFTVGTGSFGVLSFKYQLTKETSTWLAIFTAVLGLGEIGVFIPSNFGSVLIFMASIASILYFFWLGSIIFVIRQNMKEDKFEKVELPEKLAD